MSMTPTTTHTPGPWTFDPQFGDIGNMPGLVRHYNAHVGTYTPVDMRLESNARLIAAAPDLLAACKELRSYADLKLQGHRQDYPETHCMVQTALRMIELADAAIARAEGEVI